MPSNFSPHANYPEGGVVSARMDFFDLAWAEDVV
jgi:hypothetical protein